MAIVLEKRGKKLETAVGIRRCINPEHKSVMWVGPEHTADDQAKVESMCQCLKCRDRRFVVFKTNVPEDGD